MKIHTVKIKSASPEVYKWLNKNIGKGVKENTNAWANSDIKWSGWRSILGNYYFEFKDEKDAMLFTLRFS